MGLVFMNTIIVKTQVLSFDNRNQRSRTVSYAWFLLNRKVVDPVVRLPAKVELPNRILIRALNLVHRQDLDLRFPSVKFNCAGDADDFSLELGDPLVSRYF